MQTRQRLNHPPPAAPESGAYDASVLRTDTANVSGLAEKLRITPTPEPPAWHRTGAGRRLLRQTLILGVTLAAWWIFSGTGMARVGDIPSPWETLVRLVELVFTGTYWVSIASTLGGMFLGLAIAALVGVPVGLAIGFSRFATDSSRFVIDFLRTIPPVALIPLTLLVFGPLRPMQVTLVVIGVVWPLLIQSTYAAQQVEPVLRQVTRSFRLSRLEAIRFVFAPSALPFLWTGLRVAATVALLISITAEYLGGIKGLGYELYQGLLDARGDTVFAYVITAGALGAGLNGGLVALQRRILFWHPSERARSR